MEILCKISVKFRAIDVLSYVYVSIYFKCFSLIYVITTIINSFIKNEFILCYAIYLLTVKVV